VGIAYNQTITASGGTASKTFTISTGALPADLTLSSSGTLSGTPTTGGSFNFTITATDTSTGSGPFVGSQAYTLVINSVKSVSGTSPAGGTITAAFSGGSVSCSYATTAFTTPAAPAGVSMPHGVFGFTTTDCGANATLSFTITYPQALPVGTKYYKYGPTTDNPANHWYVLESAVLSSDRTQFTFSITDNGIGDSNPLVGFITDPGAAGIASVSEATSIPTLSEWGMILMSGLLSLFGVGQLRRRGMAVRV